MTPENKVHGLRLQVIHDVGRCHASVPRRGDSPFLFYRWRRLERHGGPRHVVAHEPGESGPAPETLAMFRQKDRTECL